MSGPLRCLALVAVLLAPLAGCSQAADEATPMSPAREAPTDPTNPTAATAPTLEIAVADASGDALRSFASDAPIHVVLALRNDGEAPIELTFPSGNTSDAVILDPEGREVWRWSSGQMFTQALVQKRLAPGESASAELVCEPASYDAPLSPGRYRMVGIAPVLGGEIRSAPVEIEIE